MKHVGILLCGLVLLACASLAGSHVAVAHELSVVAVSSHDPPTPVISATADLGNKHIISGLTSNQTTTAGASRRSQLNFAAVVDRNIGFVASQRDIPRYHLRC